MHQSVLSWWDSLACLAAPSGDRERHCAGFSANWINRDSFLKSVCAKTWYKLGWPHSKLEETRNGSYLKIHLRFYTGSIYIGLVHRKRCFQGGICLVFILGVFWYALECSAGALTVVFFLVEPKLKPMLEHYQKPPARQVDPCPPSVSSLHIHTAHLEKATGRNFTAISTMQTYDPAS